MFSVLIVQPHVLEAPRAFTAEKEMQVQSKHCLVQNNPLSVSVLPLKESVFSWFLVCLWYQHFSSCPEFHQKERERENKRERAKEKKKEEDGEREGEADISEKKEEIKKTLV